MSKDAWGSNNFLVAWTYKKEVFNLMEKTCIHPMAIVCLALTNNVHVWSFLWTREDYVS
jgi:hypothetical protein